VVGTHIDQAFKAAPNAKELREGKLQDLFYKKCQMDPKIAFEYIEVSCAQDQTNIEHLYQRIIETCLTHSYMGEEIPSSYLKIEDEMVNKLRVEFGKFPLMDLETALLPRLLSSIPSLTAEEAKRAIGLIHDWGECIHFSHIPELAKYVILDPTFVTQKILSSLFNPGYKNEFPKGKLQHKDLKIIWKDYADKAEALFKLLEPFEVSFELDPTSSPDFWERESIITAYLPLEPDWQVFNSTSWPPEQQALDVHQLSCTYTFNIIPKELISRLLVKLRKKMEEKTLWRTGLYLESDRAQILIRVRADEIQGGGASGSENNNISGSGGNLLDNQLEVSVRGAEPAVAREILKIIVKEIETTRENYPGITYKPKEKVFSPPQQASRESSWWMPEREEALQQHHHQIAEIRKIGMSEIKTFPIFQNGKITDEGIYSRLQKAILSLGGNIDRLEEAHYILNENSLNMFEGYRISLSTQQSLEPELFKRSAVSEDERALDSGIRKTEGLDILKVHFERFLDNMNLVSRFFSFFSFFFFYICVFVFPN